MLKQVGGAWGPIVTGSAFVVGSLIWLLVRPGAGVALFLAVSLVFLGRATISYLRRGAARVRVAGPEVAVPDKPLRVGEQFSVSYRQGWKRATEVSRIRFELVLRETAKYTVSTNTGSSTETKKHDEVVQGFAVAGQRFEPGQTINENRTFRIPANGMHPFTADNNRIEWYVVASIEMQGWPDYRWERELAVVPDVPG